MIIAIIPQPRRCRYIGQLSRWLAAGAIAAFVAGPIRAWALESDNPEEDLATIPASQIQDTYLRTTNSFSAVSTNPPIGGDMMSTNASEPSSAGANESGPETEQNSDDLITIGPIKQKMYEALYNVQDQYYDLAIPKLEWVIRSDPTLMAAWQALGWAYWGVGRKDDAMKLWERLQILAPNEPLSYNCMAMAAAQTNDIAKASALYRKSLALNPDQYDIRYAFARTLAWLGNFDEAISGLNALLKQDPDRTDVRLELAKALMSCQKYDEALTHWTIICERAPDNVAFALAKAHGLLLLGDVESADEETRNILQMDPNNIQALSLMTDIAEFSHKPEDAARDLRKLADRTKDNYLKSKILYRLTSLLRRLHETNPEDYPLRKSIAVADEGVNCDPRNVEMLLLLGEMLNEDQQYVTARNAFEKVLKDFNKDNLRAKRGLFEICLERGQWDEAEYRLKEMYARFDPYDPYRYYYWSRLEFARGNFFKAMQMLDRLEEEGARGAVFMLLYHGLSDIEWTTMTSVRRLREHLQALKRAGVKFIAPDQIPAYFEARPPPPKNDTKPLMSRWWRWISYSFTGKDKPQPSPLRGYHPEKVACVTFDDGLRSTLFYGTPIAEELGTRFGSYIIISGVLKHSPLHATWEELRRYEETGYWTFGSHLANAHAPLPIDAEGHLAYPLPNQLWDPARNRMETLRAYLARIRSDFKGSRDTIIKEVGLKTNECRIVAYPYGEIGQQTVCNVQNVDNVCETILNEAGLNYDMGLIQSQFGYALKSDNPLLYQRHEPDRWEGGKDVVRQAFENHPVFLARRARAEIAAMQGKPNLAEEMLKELGRDGYPEDSLKKLSTYVKDHLAGEIQKTQVGPAESKREARWLALEHPYIGGEFTSTRDNVVIDEWHLTGRAGINLNPRLTVEALGGIGHIKDTITVTQPYTFQTVQGTTNKAVVTTTQNGSNSVTETITETYTATTTKTNTIYSEDFLADEQMAGLRLSYRIPGGTLLFGELRQRSFTAKPQTQWTETITNINGVVTTNIGPATFTNDTEIVGALELQLKPLLALDVVARYEHDVMPSAHAIITYNSGALRSGWRIQDWWNLEAYGVYSFLSDANTMLRMGANTEWLLSENQGLYMGLQYQFITTEDASIEYWTPYWQQRFYLTARLQRSYFSNYTSVQARLGWSKELLRPEEEQINPDREQPGWSPMVGADINLRRNLFRHLDIFGQASVNILQDYTERHVVVGLIYDFQGK